MKFLIAVSLTLSCVTGFAQNADDNKLQLELAIEWLEDKLTYNYYNVNDNEWWINRFTFNEGSKSITIKNIAAPRLDAISDKTYLQLNFQLEDLNPYTVKVEEVKSNAGRLVEGKAIRVGAYHYDKSIKRVRNGRVATNQSFIYLSIPKFFEDSVENYTKSIAEKFSETILLATNLFSESPGPENVEILKSLLGNDRFLSGNTYWEVQNIYGDVFEILEQDKEYTLLRKMFLRFDTEGKEIEFTIVDPNNTTTTHILKASADNGLSFTNERYALTFTNLNEFTLNDNGTKRTFLRDWNFELSEPKYR